MSIKRLRKAGRKPTTRPVAFRFPNPLLGRLDEHAKRESERTGYVVSRSAFLLKIVEESLDRREAAQVPQEAAQNELDDPEGQEATEEAQEELDEPFSAAFSPTPSWPDAS